MFEVNRDPRGSVWVVCDSMRASRDPNGCSQFFSGSKMVSRDPNGSGNKHGFILLLVYLLFVVVYLLLLILVLGRVVTRKENRDLLVSTYIWFWYLVDD